jgi:hypothetical protein
MVNYFVKRIITTYKVIYNSIQENHGREPMDELNADMSSLKKQETPAVRPWEDVIIILNLYF